MVMTRNLDAAEAPVFSEIFVQAVTDTSAKVYWTTSTPGSSFIEYGTSAKYDSASPVDEIARLCHSVTLTGLKKNTTYHYRVCTIDIHEKLHRSDDRTLKTLPKEPSKGKIYYISTSGNDANDGLTVKTAWKTIAYAVGKSSRASAGDTIYVLDGRYSEGSSKVRFQKDGITLTAYNRKSPKVVIDGGKEKRPNNFIFKIQNRRNISISKLEIINGYDCIDIRRSKHIRISECDIHGSTSKAICIYDGSHYCYVEKCKLHNCRWNIMMFAGRTDQGNHGVSTHLSLTNCEIYDGVNHNLLDFMGDMEHIDVIGNKFYRGRHGTVYSHQENPKGIGYLNFRSNHISDSVAGPHFETPLYNCTFTDNTFRTNGRWHIMRLRERATNVIFKGNSVRGDTTAGLYPMVRVNGKGIVFEKNDIISKYKDAEYDILEDGSGIVRNAVGNTYKVQSRKGSTVTVEYTDGRKFSLNGKGKYTSRVCPEGSYKIVVFGLSSLGTISGTVRDISGKPIAGVIVTNGGKYVTTNATGRYAIIDVRPGKYRLVASKAGYQPKTLGVSVKRADKTTIDFQIAEVGKAKKTGK